MAGFSVTSLYQLPRHCTPKARQVVLNIIDSAKTPLKTQDIYKLALQPAVATKSPPAQAKPSQPTNNEDIRSMRYLKTVVLRDLAGQNHIEKVRMQGVVNGWVWRRKATLPVISVKSTKSSSPALSGFQHLSPAAVGVGEDWSHLNKRRQRARQRKVERDLERMREVERFQRKVAKKAAKKAAKAIVPEPAPQSPTLTV